MNCDLESQPYIQEKPKYFSIASFDFIQTAIYDDKLVNNLKLLFDKESEKIPHDVRKYGSNIHFSLEKEEENETGSDEPIKNL